MSDNSELYGDDCFPGTPCFDAAERLSAELEQQLVEVRKENEDLHNRYHLLATEMVYEGNSVQYWRDKALAYKRYAGIVSRLREMLAEMDNATAEQGGDSE